MPIRRDRGAPSPETPGDPEMPNKKPKKPAAALEYLDKSFFDRNPKHIAELEEVRAGKEIARKIYELRTKAGLSQKELAQQACTTARTIAKLESDESPRHALGMLRQVAAALG